MSSTREGMMNVEMLDHLNMTVRDVEETADWYGRVFGFEPVEAGVHQGRRFGILKSGEALLCVYEHRERAHPDIDRHGHHGVAHFGLRISDRDEWEGVIRREGVRVTNGGAVEWPRGTSWYIEDPNGYEIEVALWEGGRSSFR